MKISILSFLLIISFATYSQDKLVKANGHNYNVYVKGFENRKPGAPAIIFENGLGVGLGHWETIIDQVAGFAPVFAYDRSGMDKSEKVYQMPTVELVADNLKALLNTLNIPPPYVLVGHSLGGVYIRGFAGFYPNDIAGMIFIDPADFTETKEDWKSLLTRLGVAGKRVDEMSNNRIKQASQVDSLHFGPWSETQVLSSLRRTDFAELNNLPLPNVPIYFFIGGKFEVPPERRSKDFDQQEFFIVRTNLNIERWKKFIYSSSKGGALIYLSNCGHFVHRDDPKSVIGNIKIMLESLDK